MHKMWLALVSCAFIMYAQEVPEPLANGEGTKSSGVSISGTPAAQFRIQAGMRTLQGDDRAFRFTFIDHSLGIYDTSVIQGLHLAKDAGAWGLGLNLESNVQRPVHLALAFDAQFGAFSMFGLALGAGYNQRIIKDRLWLQAKSDIVFGYANVNLGAIPTLYGYARINGTWFDDDELAVSMTSTHVVVRPELNAYIRVTRKGMIMLGGGYQVPISASTPSFTFSGTSYYTDEEETESLEITEKNVIFEMDGKKTDKVNIAPDGLVINISYVFEL